MGEPINLEKEDHTRDSDFNKAMHGTSSQAKGGVSAMFAKDRQAKKAAMDEYFKHFDNKKAENETNADREGRTAEYATLTRQ
jgi:sterol 24-C-methyltransferase